MAEFRNSLFGSDKLAVRVYEGKYSYSVVSFFGRFSAKRLCKNGAAGLLGA
jgi:hypothetical protein